MHYTSDAFSKNEKPTIQRLDCPECPITRKNTFSSLDVKGINMLYTCSNPGKWIGLVKLGTNDLVINQIPNFITNSLLNFSIAPSCNDGLQNQNEAGIDCGGPCPACSKETTFQDMI